VSLSRTIYPCLLITQINAADISKSLRSVQNKRLQVKYLENVIFQCCISCILECIRTEVVISFKKSMLSITYVAGFLNKTQSIAYARSITSHVISIINNGYIKMCPILSKSSRNFPDRMAKNLEIRIDEFLTKI
jgi:hypothetical protein